MRSLCFSHKSLSLFLFSTVSLPSCVSSSPSPLFHSLSSRHLVSTNFLVYITYPFFLNLYPFSPPLRLYPSITLSHHSQTILLLLIYSDSSFFFHPLCYSLSIHLSSSSYIHPYTSHPSLSIHTAFLPLLFAPT